MRFLTIVILGVACLTGNLHLKAQQLGLEYDSEWQTNFRGDYNWVNLLRLNGAIEVSRSLSFQAATISIANTSGDPLIDDMQGYSNIQEDNLPLGIAVLGAEYTHRRSTFFLGIRNANEDYFTSPVTSLFVNSSCGIFPTISGNYDIANYPLSSWCLHYKAELDAVTIQASVYEGLGHRRIAGHDNVFTFSPRRDGVFTITSVDYDKNGSIYSMGCALYYGMHLGDEDRVEEIQEKTPKKTSIAQWINVEQRITDACTAMLQASYSTAKANCRCYFGLGAAYQIGEAQLGLFADYAKYATCTEKAAELTCLVQITEHLSIQPALEVIHCSSHTDAIGILRLKISI